MLRSELKLGVGHRTAPPGADKVEGHPQGPNPRFKPPITVKSTLSSLVNKLLRHVDFIKD